MIKDKNHYRPILERYSYDYAQAKYQPFKQKEAHFNWKLKKDYYYVIRLDGKGMTKGFKIKHKAINEQFFNTMKDTFKEFCESTPNLIFGYSFSDEISILIKKSYNDKDDYNRIEKLLSLLPSKLTLIFYRNALKHNLDLHDKDWIFDARIIQLKEQEVVNYFLARQAYAIDKYIMQLKTENGIDFKFKTSKSVLPLLKERGVIYESLPEQYRYGIIYSPTLISRSFEFNTNQSLLKQLCLENNISH
ncbi:MAG: tRNA(His) guanylyltransferase Thg1 family protein [Bacilli bacterium]|nr:tRNA(His) guanylyltransferase Thg1 family protein [Bacilli bacterium]